MPVVEQSGMRLEYLAGDEQPIRTNGTMKLRARVMPPHVNNRVWFAYRVDEGQWLRRQASREFANTDEEQYSLAIDVSTGQAGLRYLAFVRRSGITMPRGADSASPDEDHGLKEFVAYVSLTDDNAASRQPRSVEERSHNSDVGLPNEAIHAKPGMDGSLGAEPLEATARRALRGPRPRLTVSASPAVPGRTMDQQVWMRAIKEGVIPSARQNDIPTALQAFQSLSAQKLLTSPARVDAGAMGTVPQDDSAPVVCPLEASARQVLKGTLVKLKLAPPLSNGHGLAKYGLVQQLAITKGDTDSVREHLEMAGGSSNRGDSSHQISAPTLDLLRSFEQPIVPAMRPNISAIAAVPLDELATFAKALVQVRARRVQTAQQNELATIHVGAMMQSLNSAVVATQGFAINTAAQPIGMLNLERIEMVPAGLQRGELVATIPLAPGEETAVTHKEWSVTSKEFTTIVTDSLEQTSETGVTDNTDLSQSTASQTQHSTQFNITGTVQGGIPMINGSSTAGVTAQDANSQSATDSIKHATSITQKASARSRQEHKTTISTTTVTGSSETSTRILKNTSTTDPIRIDYFSLMRKWRVRLYRFGLRLTYDMVVPQPGAAMRRAYMDLDALRGQIGPFVFNVKHTDLTTKLVNKDTGKPPAPGDQTIPRYQWYADQFQVSVPPYPENPSPITADATNDGSQEWVKIQLEFDVPSGTAIKKVFLDCNINRDPNGGGMIFHMIGTQFWPVQLTDEGTGVILKQHFQLFDAPGSTSPFLAGRTGHQKIYSLVNDGERIILQLTVELENLPVVMENWQDNVWNTLYNAAQTQYYARQQDIAARIVAIEEKLANVDTLTLRREESDEVMKSILKFVLGTEFNFMPPEVLAIFQAESKDLTHGISFDGQTVGGLNYDQWTLLGQHEDIVRFINQAIEWENVVTFLYSYFWDLPQSWDFIRELRHPDANRQAFLRAGSARVVLTVRKGWEAKWMRFVQDLKTTDADIAAPTTGPYLTIAQEIAAYDDRNYPGIPPANPARAAVRLQDAVYTTSSVKIDPSTTPVSIEVASSAGFVVGLRVILDVEDDRHIQEAVVITEIPEAGPTGTGHIIIVAEVAHTHDGTQGPFAVLQPGDKGALIAEWYEYTPSSGTDIAVTSNLTTIA